MRTVRCEALVVGAGPAGATAACLLASAGVSVVLLDARRFPRPKLCGGLLTWKTIRTLEELFGVDPATLAAAGALHAVCRRYRVAGRRGRFVEGRLAYPFHLVDRTAYDDLWLRRAVAAGAEFHPQTAVARIDPSARAAMTADGRLFQAEIVIAADGAASRIRRTLERQGRLPGVKRHETAAALEVTVAAGAGGPFPDYPVIAYGWIPWGYAWSFPGAHGRLIGMAALKRRAGRRLRARFADFLSTEPLPPAPWARPASREIPFGNYLRRPGWDRILLAGDAAGMADPFLGEGIYYAHRSGALAARAVIACRGRPGAALAVYTAAYRALIYPELRYARAGRGLVFSLPPALYYPVLTTWLRCARRICEETIQGQRSFRWFRRVDPRPHPAEAASCGRP